MEHTTKKQLMSTAERKYIQSETIGKWSYFSEKRKWTTKIYTGVLIDQNQLGQNRMNWEKKANKTKDIQRMERNLPLKLKYTKHLNHVVKSSENL